MLFKFKLLSTQPEDEADQDMEPLAEHVNHTMDREMIRAMCQHILDRTVVPIHRSSQAIHELNGILQDVFERLTCIETSERSGNTNTQQKQSTGAVV